MLKPRWQWNRTEDARKGGCVMCVDVRPGWYLPVAKAHAVPELAVLTCHEVELTGLGRAFAVARRVSFAGR